MGAGLGGLTIFGLFHTRMLAERSGVAVLLMAIAFFYPVFAAIQGDIPSLVLHLAIFGGFTALAIRGFAVGMHILAGGLIAHGVFDAGLMFFTAPGPSWWPPFCAGVDITAGAALIRLIQTRKVAR